MDTSTLLRWNVFPTFSILQYVTRKITCRSPLSRFFTLLQFNIVKNNDFLFHTAKAIKNIILHAFFFSIQTNRWKRARPLTDVCKRLGSKATKSEKKQNIFLRSVEKNALTRGKASAYIHLCKDRNSMRGWALRFVTTMRFGLLQEVWGWVVNRTGS